MPVLNRALVEKKVHVRNVRVRKVVLISFDKLITWHLVKQLRDNFINRRFQTNNKTTNFKEVIWTLRIRNVAIKGTLILKHYMEDSRKVDRSLKI